MEHRCERPSAFGGEHPSAAVIAHEERVDEVVAVAECLLPERFDGDFVRMEVYGRELAQGHRGVVGELRAPKSFDAEVLLAVDEREPLGQMLCEELVDDRESAVVAGVGLLDMGVERAVVDGRSVGEGCEFAAGVDAASDEFQRFE